MTSKDLLKGFALIFTLGIVLLSFSILVLSFYLPGKVSSYYVKPTAPVVGIPVRLEISKINVDAPIISVGVAKDGSMGAPTGPKEVGWFKFGVKPGEIGSAVIDGHYGYWKNGQGSVFDDLNKLRKGDQLYVKDSNGAVTIFIVRKILTYDPNKDASAVFSSSDGIAHLNVITCEGVWNNTTKTYSNRLVVFTDKK